MEKADRYGCDIWSWENADTHRKYQVVSLRGSVKFSFWYLEPNAGNWRQAYERDIPKGRTAEAVAIHLHGRTKGKKRDQEN